MRHVLVVPILAALACGGSSGSGLTAADVQRMNTLAQDVSTAATAYGTQAGTMTNTASCTADENAYDSGVRPKVHEMQDLAPMMDDRMGTTGHMSDADMTCTADAMMAELDRHHAVACASTSDMGPNVTEAQQHVAAMTDWADHQMARSQEMGGMMGGTGGMGGTGSPSGHCVHDDTGYHMGP